MGARMGEGQELLLLLSVALSGLGRWNWMLAVARLWVILDSVVSTVVEAGWRPSRHDLVGRSSTHPA